MHTNKTAPLTMKPPSSALNNASKLSFKTSSLVVCFCIGMSQLNLVTSFTMIPPSSSSSSSPESASSSRTLALLPSSSTKTTTATTTTSTRLSMSSRGGGNFQGRLGRYGGIPEEDEQEQAFTWDWDDDEDDVNNDDMFGQAQQQQSQSSNNINTSSGDDSELPTGDIPGATISEDLKQKAKNSHLDAKEEASQGGSKFRELMARATQQTAVTPPPQPTYAPPPPQPVTTASIPPNPMDLSIEEQAALFRQMMMEKQDPHAQEMAQFQKQQQQQERKMKDPYQAATPRVYGPPPDLRHPYSHPDPAVSLPPPAPTRPKDYREYGTGPDGRKVGRNADADSVSNAADVYLAQLKRDSTTRNYARYAGDDQVANQVFHDPSIAEIHAPENPYREAQREKERELYDTVPEEMLIFQEYTKVEEYQAAPRMSYKEKLAQYKDKKEQQQQQQQQGGQQEQ